MEGSSPEHLTTTKELNDWLQNETKRLRADSQLLKDSFNHQPLYNSPRYHGKTSDEIEHQRLDDEKKLSKIEETLRYLKATQELNLDIDKIARVLKAEKAEVCIDKLPMENGTAKLPVVNVSFRILSVSSPDPLQRLEIFPGQRKVYLFTEGIYHKKFHTFRCNGLESVSCVESISGFTSVVRLEFTGLAVILTRYTSVEICSKTL